VKALEHLVVRVRSRVREERARRGLGGPPARLVVRLDDFDAPNVVGDARFTLDDWQEAVVRVIEWSGALPVHIVGRSDHKLLAEMVRFAHRLECPTTLRTDARVLAHRADELVDCGLDRVIIRRDDDLSLSDAIQSCLDARISRKAALEIRVELPFVPRTAAELRAASDAAVRAGADGVELAIPWSGGPFAQPTVDSALALRSATNGRTTKEVFDILPRMDGAGPGAPRQRGSCGVGTARVELLPDGSLRCCPFKADTVRLGDAMAPAWAAMAAHRSAVQRCDRVCGHPELLS
jgi:hypothetical protein